MKESHEVRPSQSPRPRVMRRVGSTCGGSRRSVHRGTAGPCIELRKHLFCGGRPCPDKGKATVMSNDHGESDITPTESRDHGHGWKLSSRKPGDPGNIRFARSGSVGEGAMPQVRHARFRGVRQFHSTEEAGEQRRLPPLGGVCGGKGADRGERRIRLWRTTGPDTAPGSRVAWTAGCTSSGTRGSCPDVRHARHDPR